MAHESCQGGSGALVSTNYELLVFFRSANSIKGDGGIASVLKKSLLHPKDLSNYTAVSNLHGTQMCSDLLMPGISGGS